MFIEKSLFQNVFVNMVFVLSPPAVPAMLDEAVLYLRAKELAAPDRFTYEIIVVSDGSRDRTVEVAQSYCRTVGSNKVRVLALERNRGKGGAVRLGVQSARGRLILFADADGATQFDELDKLLAAVQPHLGPEADGSGDAEALAIGSRAHLEAAAMAERSLFRTVLMHGFHALVWLFAVRGVRDTQCGFKLFTRRAARTLFGLMHVERWAFDVEVLFVAQHLRMPIAELAVRWTEIDGSKVVPVWSWLQMGRDLVVIWFRYAIGAWSLRRRREADGSEDGMGTWGGKKLL